MHLAELKALAYSNDRYGIKSKYHNFETVIQQFLKNKCCTEHSRENVLAAEATLLTAIHKLETESWLDRLSCFYFFLIGIPTALFFVLWVLWLLDINDLINPLPLWMKNVLPDVLNDQGWLILVAALIFILLLIRRTYRRLEMKWRKFRYKQTGKFDVRKQGSQCMKPTSFDFNSRRSMISARRGMVGASNPLAAQAGLNILRQGGNAADAAVATSAMMNVMDPGSCGVGGDCFALYYDARSKQVSALNGSGRAPRALTLEKARALGWEKMKPRHAHAVTVPGAVRGWQDLLARHGSMSLADVLAEAIFYADEGFALAPVVGARWARSGAFLRSAINAEDYLPNGALPEAGQVMRLPGLAKTLRAIAAGGPEAFYSGPIADAIVSALQEQGGLMTHEDLRDHRSTWQEPIATDYRGLTIFECPPNGQGLTALIALNIAENFDLGALPWHSPQRMHLMVECMRLAWADAHEYIADMSQAELPLDMLLSKAYAAERAAQIQDYYAMQPPPAPGALPGGSDTIYLSVVDGAGNACSFIKSLYMGFGVGIVAKGTGVWLQNRGAGFSLQPGHRNCLAPGKRPYHTIIPGMALKDGALWASFGVMGGFMQPQGHFQVISALVDDALNPQAALNRPRWMIENGDPGGSLLIEEGTPFKTMADLAERGHRIQPEAGLGRGNFGRGQIIRYDAETGVMHGGSEPRADGQIAAF